MLAAALSLRWLSFVRGIVDSDTLPLSVSRETLQQHSALKTIKKKLVRKILDIIKKMSDDEKQCQKQEEEERAKQEEAKEKAEEEEGKDRAKDEQEDNKLSEEECKKYGKFWSAFGKVRAGGGGRGPAKNQAGSLNMYREGTT